MSNLSLERTRRELINAMQPGIPASMHESVCNYVLYGQMPGQFLQHVIENNLHGAAFTGDDENIKAIREWARLFFNHVPPNAYGSTLKRRAWQAQGGLEGLLKDAAHA